MREEDRALLEELLLARGPGGQEDEVRAICQRELEGCCDEVGSDAAGNLVARISPPHLPREQRGGPRCGCSRTSTRSP